VTSKTGPADAGAIATALEVAVGVAEVEGEVVVVVWLQPTAATAVTARTVVRIPERMVLPPFVEVLWF